MNELINHYDLLVDENNDPVHDRKSLKVYMDKWDGAEFINDLELNTNKSVLEIGVGTGRLAVKTAPLCKSFIGIDVSPKTIMRAKENLSSYNNVYLICDDFCKYEFNQTFDTVYSSLTFMHIEDKQAAINKVSSLLNYGGKFVLSIDKSIDDVIDTGTRRIEIFPDNPQNIRNCILKSGLIIDKQYETEFAHIFVAVRRRYD